MLGVVLCGGQSTRMGSDKGLLKAPPPPEGGISTANTWAQTAIDKLYNLQLSVVISVNKNQYEGYASIFSPEMLVTDDDTLQMKGPLCGVLSVHIKYPAEDLLILACDMPLMETDLIKELLVQYKEQPNYDAFIYTNDGEPEPLLCIYKAKGLATVYELYKTNQLPRHSMKYMLEHIKTFSLALLADKKQCFRNFNAHAELNGL
jgi:molybdenum cofactor guanylyltransferase